MLESVETDSALCTDSISFKLIVLATGVDAGLGSFSNKLLGFELGLLMGCFSGKLESIVFCIEVSVLEANRASFFFILSEEAVTFSFNGLLRLIESFCKRSGKGLDTCANDAPSATLVDIAG